MEQKFEKVALEADAGERLDVYVSQWLPDVTRSRVQNLLAEGLILVDGKKVKAGYKLKNGNNVQVILPELKDLSALPEKMGMQSACASCEELISTCLPSKKISPSSF